jgi:hypothetical protein
MPQCNMRTVSTSRASLGPSPRSTNSTYCLQTNSCIKCIPYIPRAATTKQGPRSLNLSCKAKINERDSYRNQAKDHGHYQDATVICEGIHTVYCFIPPSIMTLPQSKRNRIYLCKKPGHCSSICSSHKLPTKSQKKRRKKKKHQQHR